MIYRPQSAYKTPDGYRDEPFDYYFDELSPQLINILNVQASSVPYVTALTVGSQITGIPFQLDPDAEFHWKSTVVGIRNQDFTSGAGAPSNGSDASTIVLRWRDPYGNYLSNDYEPVGWYASDAPMVFNNSLSTNSVISPYGSVGPSRVWEPEVFCPAGSTVLLDLAVEGRASQAGKNILLFGPAFGNNSGLASFPFYLRGFKRYPKENPKCR